MKKRPGNRYRIGSRTCTLKKFHLHWQSLIADLCRNFPCSASVVNSVSRYFSKVDGGGQCDQIEHFLKVLVNISSPNRLATFETDQLN